MKYCLSNRQSKEYLQKCNEIKILYIDRNDIYDLIEEYPDKTLILQLPAKDYVIDYEELRKFNILTKYKLICSAPELSMMQECKNRDIAFYYSYPVDTYSDLNFLTNLGVSQVILEAPLFFDLEKIAQAGVKVRAVANRTTSSNFPLGQVCGTWIRPEDVEAYDPYVVTIEFDSNNLENEKTLFRIYAEDKTWNGYLYQLIARRYSAEDLVFNNARCNKIAPTLVEKRINCGQRCAQPEGKCKACEYVLTFANPTIIETLNKKDFKED